MAGKNILLVEDNEVNRRLAGFLLRSQGYLVREATSAAAAFELLDKEPVDLIVMDIQLPGIGDFVRDEGGSGESTGCRLCSLCHQAH
jgi:CheY-like chemotaxis protein